VLRRPREESIIVQKANANAPGVVADLDDAGITRFH
jgi:hypothetical protein